MASETVRSLFTFLTFFSAKSKKRDFFTFFELSHTFSRTLSVVVICTSRTVFSSEQLRKLEELFDETHYPDTSQRDAVSSETRLSDDRIQVQSTVLRLRGAGEVL